MASKKVCIGGFDELTLTYYQYEHMEDPEVTIDYVERSHDYWSGDTDVSVTVSRDQAIQMIKLLTEAFNL